MSSKKNKKVIMAARSEGEVRKSQRGTKDISYNKMEIMGGQIKMEN